MRTIGRVTAKEPENHNFVKYSFEVNGHTYSGLGTAGGENPGFHALEIGSSVVVHFDPVNPDISFLGDPIRQAKSATNGVIFVALVGSILSMIGLYHKGWLPITKNENQTRVPRS
jgi:hypothetical protein